MIRTIKRISKKGRVWILFAVLCLLIIPGRQPMELLAASNTIETASNKMRGVLQIFNSMEYPSPEERITQNQSIQSQIALNDFNRVWVSHDSSASESIAWGDMDGDGDLDIVAGNGNLQINRVYRNDTNGKFVDVTDGDLAVDQHRTSSIALGDMDGDGDLDIVVGNYAINQSSSINRVYRNDGNGVFIDITAGDLATASNQTQSIALGDMDGDGDLDIVIGNNDNQPNNVFRNDGNGEFTDVTDGDLAEDISETQSVKLGDTDGDGDLDIVVGNYNQTNKIYQNIGGGVFNEATLGDFGTHTDLTTSVALGDADGDGDLDILVGSLHLLQNNRVYRNEGNGAFNDVTAGDLLVESFPTKSVAWGDIDGDGDLDIVVGNSSNRSSKIYLNEGNMTFNNVASSDLDSDTRYTESIALGDMDGDGDLDILTGNHQEGNHVYRNEGYGVFNNITNGDLVTDTEDTRSVAWGDMDRDGDFDILVGNYNQVNRIYRNNGDNSFSEITSGDLAADMDNTVSVAWGDIDGDGDLDILSGNKNEINKVYRNDGSGIFTNVTNGDLATDADNTTAVAWGDMDGDGDLDILVGNMFQTNKIYRNEGQGIFNDITVGELSVAMDDTRGIDWGDMDGDGDLDILIGNYNQANKIYRNDGNGIFTNVANGDLATTMYSTASVSWGDMDGDGDLDILVGNNGQTNKVYRNEGNNSFIDVGVGDLSSDADKTTAITRADMDGDGDLDILVGNYNQANKVYRNEGNFTFTDVTAGDLTVDVGFTQSITWGDMDRDGDPDVLVGNGISFGQSNQVYRNPHQDFKRDKRPGIQPVVSILPPAPAAMVNHFGNAKILTTQSISTSLTLSNTDLFPIGNVTVWYSINGGGQWFPAISTDGSENSPILSGTHIFSWDTFASGFFGQSDSVMLQVIAGLHMTDGEIETFIYPNAAAGPILYGASSATTTPFRVRGTQVQVVDAFTEEAIQDAFVYRLPENATNYTVMGNEDVAFRTDGQGYLQGRGELALGDQIIALRPISTTSKYTHYHASADVSTTGFYSAFEVTTPGIQTLTVSSENSLLIFNLDVSLEWDASQDSAYLQQLENDIERASQIIYDLSDGQVMLGEVNVYHNMENWLTADVVVKASNALRPSAVMGGVTTEPRDAILSDGTHVPNGYLPGQVNMAAQWNRFGNASGTIGEDWPRTLAHELAHYLLYLPDNYLGLDGQGRLIQTNCQGSVMTDAFREDYSEFLTNAEWTGDCLNTVAQHSTGRPDWEAILAIYPFLNGTGNNAGPATMPLDLTEVIIHEPLVPSVTLPDPYMTVVDDNSIPLPLPGTGVAAYQIDSFGTPSTHDDRIIPLGVPTGDQLRTRGVQPGDTVCLTDASSDVRRTGCTTVGNTTDALMLNEHPAWQPQVEVTSVSSTTLKISVTQVLSAGEALEVQLFPRALVTDTGVITAPLVTLTDVGNDVYETLIQPDMPLFEGHVLVRAVGTDKIDVSSFFFGGGWAPNLGVWGPNVGVWGPNMGVWGPNVGVWGPNVGVWGPNMGVWGANSRGWNAPITVADGQVTLFDIEHMFGVTPPYQVQSVNTTPHLDSWLTPVGMVQRVVAPEGVEPTTSIMFNYLQRNVPNERYEDVLQIYHLPDGSTTWQPLDTALETTRNLASALMPGEGMYALIQTIHVGQLYTGWNNVPYLIRTTRPTPEAVASLGDKYTTVYKYVPQDPDNWLLYDRTVPPEFADLVNTLPEMNIGAYWIYATEPVEWYLGVDIPTTRTSAHSSTGNVLPPTTYYGWVTNAVGNVGSSVSAWIDGVQCGTSSVVSHGEGMAFAIQVKSENPFGAQNGCGQVGKQIEFKIEGTTVGFAAWDEQQSQELQVSVPTAVELESVQAIVDIQVMILLITAFSVLMLIYMLRKRIFCQYHQ